MVSSLAPKFGFNIDSLLGGDSKMSAIGAEFLSVSESAFTNLTKPTTTKDVSRLEILSADRDRIPPVQPPVTMPTPGHQHKDSSDFCLQCLDSSTINLQDTLISSVRPYDTTNQHLLNRNNINNKTLYRNNAYQTNSWSIFDSSTPTPALQSYELSQHSNIGNFGLKLHNNLVQLDNISNISSVSNIQNISNTYSPFSSLYPGLSTGQFGSQVGQSRVDHAVTGPAFTWGTPRGMGFLTPRCSDSGLFMPSYRKPKRVRTAFSPTQLLRLEHAFEKNHYVVGQERKELSASLNLSETQVKVWFQNRRTKHKRMQTEEELTASLSKRLGDDRISRTPSLEDVIIDQ